MWERAVGRGAREHVTIEWPGGGPKYNNYLPHHLILIFT